jgi:transposase-like protein
MTENQEQRRIPVYCTYCGTPYPATEQWRTSGPIQCETCGGTQYLGSRYQQRSHIIEVICPNRKCSERTLVNKLERAGKAKTGCHACDEQILVQTDAHGKLTGISLIKRSKMLTTKQWLGVMVCVLIMGIALGMLFQSGPATTPAAANTVSDQAPQASPEGGQTGASLPPARGEEQPGSPATGSSATGSPPQ